MNPRTKLLATLLGACLTTHALSGMAQNVKTLKVVPHADLKILDPVLTTAGMTRTHGYNIYDTLYGVDINGKVHPQMVDSHATNANQTEWTFKLRDGLAFHDGAPVTSADVIASLKRWASRDDLSGMMMKSVASVEAVNTRTFVLKFKQPFGAVLDVLSKPGGSPLFIMPKRVAETPSDKPITDTTGSGPYIFKADEYRPGEKVVYVKNTKYIPRKEVPSGTAGAKHVFIDRLEWIILRDGQTMSNALTKGEVDMLENVPPDQRQVLRDTPTVTLGAQIPTGSVALHLNHHVPPFNNPKIARAALLAVNQAAMMKALVLQEGMYRTCASIYPCGTAYGTEDPIVFTGKPQFEKAKALLKEARYDGKPVLLMQDTNIFTAPASVLKALLTQAGFNVNMQSMDWSTMLTRRASKALPEQGGWNMFITSWTPADNLNPLYYPPLTGTGEEGWFGWAKDDQLEKLKSEYLVASDDSKRKSLAAAIQKQVLETGLLAPVGDFRQVQAYRKDVVTGVVPSPVYVYWNVNKN